MKKVITVVLMLFVISCGGEEGPAGPPGPQGPASGSVYEVQASFSEGNDYTVFSTLPTNIEVLESDIVAVYLLWEVDPETGNDVWQPLPVSVFFDTGELQYGFDYTVADVKLFLTGDVDLNTLDDSFTQDQVFRIAILPADFVQSNKIDVTEMDEVMNAVGANDVKQLQLEN